MVGVIPLIPSRLPYAYDKRVRCYFLFGSLLCHRPDWKCVRPQLATIIHRAITAWHWNGLKGEHCPNLVSTPGSHVFVPVD